MFFIINISNKRITLSDINIDLKKNQAIDLDKRIKRKVSDNSIDLKKALAKGYVQVKVKDEYNNNNNNTNDDNINNIKDNNLDNIKKDIVSNVKSELKDFTKELLSQINKKEDNNIDKIENIIQKTISGMPAPFNNEQLVKNIKNNIKEDKDIEINEDVLSEINAKTINNMIEGTRESRVRKNKKTFNDSIKKNISELDNLL